MSSINYVMFSKSLNKQSFGKEKVDFVSLQNELFNNLLCEFISPIEREDIFLLQKWLEEEFISICSFGLFKIQKNLLFTAGFDEVKNLLNDNVRVFEELKNFKTPKKLIKITRENKKQAINLYCSLKQDFSELPGQNARLCLLTDVVYSVYGINTEIEKIIINNN